MQRKNINRDWKFLKLPGYRFDYDEQVVTEAMGLDWVRAETVTLPHTWYEEKEAYEGVCAYMKKVRVEEKAEKIYLEFEGVEQRCVVFVNGRAAGRHKGSYAAFRVEVAGKSEGLEGNQATAGMEEMEILVLVDNTRTEELAPMFGDFTVFGGIYRDVNLLLSVKAGFDYMYYGTNGIIARSHMEEGAGLLELEPHVTEAVSGEAVIRYTLLDPLGKEAAEKTAGARESCRLYIGDPVLWNGKGKASCYRLRAELLLGEEELDVSELTVGFRQVELSAERGLLLNGSVCRLKGVAKHQDYAGVYNAVTKDHIHKDFELIEEIGANAVRLSHYQHPGYAYELCDERGYLVWAEIPMLKLTGNEELFETTCSQLKELILQNIHHPSIFCWGIQNEIAMFKDDPFMHERCLALSDLVHKYDPYRYSAGANLYSVKYKSRMNEVSDMVGYNIYFGWYYGQMEDYDSYLDGLHAAKPFVPFGVSEYGVDANTTLHSEEPAVKDYSEEYQALFHEKVYPILEKKDYLWGSFVWNMMDFHSEIRNEGGIERRNLKGLVTWDRSIRKDAFYYYKARWSEEPTLHICGKRFEKRSADDICIKVYSSQPDALLYINGRELGRRENDGNGVIRWEHVRLEAGENRILVRAGALEDECVFTKVSEPVSEYRLAGEGGGMVRNWFLAEDDLVREGFLSVRSRADEILRDPQAAAVLEEMFPGLYQDMTQKEEIPLGLELLSILGRSLAGTEPEERERQVKEINARLNTIRDR